MLDLVTRKSPSRPVLALGRVLPILLGLATLLFLEMSAVIRAPEAVPLPTAPPATRIVLFWIDSLSVADMATPGRLSRLKARLPKALHGPVRECMDAVSVPCFTAASTGLDRFSLFSIVRNFGGASGVPEGSVFHALQKKGHKLGFIGDMQVAESVIGFNWIEIQHEVDDRVAVERGMAALDRESLDFVVIHLRTPDELSHRVGPADPAYAEALETIDVAVDAAIAGLKPTDHVVIFGDHGHTDDGRHFAGLDVPTYMAALGPIFARPLEHGMAITDHAALWARVFGLRFGGSAWIDAYFDGGEVPASTSLPTVDSGHATLPAWAVGLALLLALVAATPHRVRWLFAPEHRALAFALVATAALVFTSGLLYTTYRPQLYYGSRGFNTGIGIASGLLGVVLAYPARRSAQATLAPLFMAGALLLALPTVYKFGGLYTGLTGLVLVVAFVGTRALAARRLGETLVATLLLALLLSIWNPAVRNFAVRWFSVFTETLSGVVAWPAVGALALLALYDHTGGRSRAWLLAGAAGLALAGLGPLFPARAFILPCVLLFPVIVLVHRRPRFEPALALIAPPALAFFFGYDPARLGPVLCAVAAFPLWARLRGDADRLERALSLGLLLWLTLWTMLGCRIGGLDFNYFFKWLPEGASVEDTVGLNFLLTTCLYMATPLLGVYLARRTAPQAVETAVSLTFALVRLKLGLVLLFIVGFSLKSADAGPFITADVLMEAGVWIVLLFFLLPVPMNGPERALFRPAPAV